MRRRWPLALVVALTLAASLGVAGAQDAAVEPEAAQEFPLLGPTRGALSTVQDDWIDWTTRVGAGENADRPLDSILATADDFGMKGLPDLAAGAGAFAVSLARDGQFDAATVALDAAERLDPGRPGNRFVGAQVARLEGRAFDGLRQYLSGVWRSLTTTHNRRLLFGNLTIWLAILVQVGGGLFVAVLMVTRGGALVGQVTELMTRYVPAWLAVVLVAVLLLWPLPLPGGLAWLLLYWSILLWGYGDRAERALLIGLWALIGVMPVLVDLQRDKVALELSAPARALDDLRHDRFTGSVFSDLISLESSLPDEPAVGQVIADLHRRLGQWRYAIAAYDRVLVLEPDNTAALVGRGVSQLQLDDTSAAFLSLRRAAEGQPEQAAAHYHLSRLLSAKYDFAESRAALDKARQIDEKLVEQWVQAGPLAETAAPDGGLERASEIEAALLARWQGGSPTWKRALSRVVVSLPLAFVFLVLAIGLQLVQRRAGRPKSPSGPWFGGIAERVRRVVLAGLPEAEAGRWVLSFLAIMVLVALLALPLAARLGYRFPWGGGSGSPLLWATVIFGLAVYTLARFRAWWGA